MRTLFILSFALGLATWSHGQATTYYMNNYTALRAPIYGPSWDEVGVWKTGNTSSGIPSGTQVYSGSLLTGGNWKAQLFGAPGLNVPENLLQPATTVNTFRTGVAAGFLAINTATFDNIPPQYPEATVQLRVWDDSSGLFPDWSTAVLGMQSGLISAWGESAPFSVFDLGGGDRIPAPLMGLRSFNVAYIPEPALAALWGVGVVSTLVSRRGRSFAGSSGKQLK